MKKLITFLLILLTCYNAYLSIRSAVWAEMIANNYMVALNKQQKCNQDVVINNRIPILERALKLPWAKKAGVLDTTLCDEAKEQWKIYEAEHYKYHHFQWLPTIKKIILR